jgi:hypothetical protein
MSAAPFSGANAVVAIYGPSGIGKTTDLLFSFPTGLFVAPPGAIKPAHLVVGHVPDHTEAASILDATKIVRERGKDKRYSAIIVDDFSLLAESTVAQLEKKFSGFKLWGALRDAVLEFRDTARHAGMHVVLTAHESTPRTVNGVFVRGGPRLPGRLPEDVPTACDVVLRAAFDQTRRGWHGCYRCTIDDPSWVTKDRHGVTPDRAPMNVAEILRSAGYVIPRAPKLEWQEELVEALAVAMFNDPANESGLVAEAIELAREQTDNDLHVRWVLRDSLDRAVLMRAKADVLSMFTDKPKPKLG